MSKEKCWNYSGINECERRSRRGWKKINTKRRHSMVCTNMTLLHFVNCIWINKPSETTKMACRWRKREKKIKLMSCAWHEKENTKFRPIGPALFRMDAWKRLRFVVHLHTHNIHNTYNVYRINIVLLSLFLFENALTHDVEK